MGQLGAHSSNDLDNITVNDITLSKAVFPAEMVPIKIRGETHYTQIFYDSGSHVSF